MHKVDEHGVGGEDADGLVDKGGEGAPLSRLTATAPLTGEPYSQNSRHGSTSNKLSL